MKVKYVLVAILIAVLALGGMGCSKVTGGGSFTNEIYPNYGNKITFGFNAHPTGPHNPDPSLPPAEIEAKGQFHLVDHTTKTKIHGTFTGTWETEEGDPTFFGTCTTNGGNPQPFNVTFHDSGEKGPNRGDGIIVRIGTTDIFGLPTYAGTLNGGNIQVHKAKKK